MALTGRASERPRSTQVPLQALHEGRWFPAEEIAKGAAYELFADEHLPGFLPNPRPGAQHRYRRFVHASDVLATIGPTEQAPPDEPLRMPVSRYLDWAGLHRLSQHPAAAAPLVAAIRRSATIRRGSRIMKVLSPRQLAACLHGWLPSGFCYREYDVAHLRTPADLGILRSDGADPGEVVFALRWRAVDALDYAVPSVGTQPGLVGLPPRDRLGPPIIGSGFAPADRHLIPEFVTADLADLPLTANAQLLAYTADGTEVTLYTYQAEQRGWTRMWGPQWRDLLAGVSDGLPGDQEYFPVPPGMTRFVGTYRGQRYDAVADPPDDFRVAAKVRAARFPVESIARRTVYAHWRGVGCTVVRNEAGWLRVRPCRPDAEAIELLGAQCVERGVYEAWAPAAEVVDAREVDVEYSLDPGHLAGR